MVAHASTSGLTTRLSQFAGRLSTAAVAAQISTQFWHSRMHATMSAR
jgi:hypothetical protein